MIRKGCTRDTGHFLVMLIKAVEMRLCDKAVERSSSSVALNSSETVLHHNAVMTFYRSSMFGNKIYGQQQLCIYIL